MRKSKQFVTMPVISLEEGQQIGSIKGLVVNPYKKEVAALVIEQKGWFKEQKFIPFSKVRSIGEDALTIDRSANVEKGASIPEIVKFFKDKVDIIGAKLVSENGTALGYVDEFYVDLQTGAIVGLEFSGGSISTLVRGKAFLDINHVRTIGKKVIVCSNEAMENVIKMDGGIQETFRSLKDSTGQIFSATVQKTRELGTNLNKSLEKVRKERREDIPEDKTSAAVTGFRSEGPEETCSCCHHDKNKEPCAATTEEAAPPRGEDNSPDNPATVPQAVNEEMPEKTPVEKEAPQQVASPEEKNIPEETGTTK